MFHIRPCNLLILPRFLPSPARPDPPADTTRCWIINSFHTATHKRLLASDNQYLRSPGAKASLLLPTNPTTLFYLFFFVIGCVFLCVRDSSHPSWPAVNHMPNSVGPRHKSDPHSPREGAPPLWKAILKLTCLLFVGSKVKLLTRPCVPPPPRSLPWTACTQSYIDMD